MNTTHWFNYYSTICVSGLIRIGYTRVIRHYILKLIISGCWFHQKDLRHLWLGWQRCIGHVLLHGYLLCSWSQHHQEGLCQVWTNGQLWKEICQVWRSSLPCSTSRQGTRELWQLPWLYWTLQIVWQKWKWYHDVGWARELFEQLG